MEEIKEYQSKVLAEKLVILEVASKALVIAFEQKEPAMVAAIAEVLKSC